MSDSQKNTATMPQCAKCDVPPKERFCTSEKGRGPANCPTLRHRKLARTLLEETSPEEKAFMCSSAIQESCGYFDRDKGYAQLGPEKPRIVEIVEFAKRVGYKKLGLIFCGGTMKEARIVHEILETNNFEVVSVMCKAGKIAKCEYGVAQKDHVNIFLEKESICNPKFQATVVNEANVDLTVLLGLCVGHDSVAIKYVQSPVTVLAVKDRVTGHSPLAPIYLYDGYYRYLKFPLPLDGEE